MDCFKDFVGIRCVCEDTEYRVYIDSLPGISLKKSALITEEGSGADLISGISLSAVDNVLMDLKSALRELGYGFNSLCCEDNKTTAGSDTWTGDEDKFYSLRIDSDLGKHKYLDVSFQIYVNCPSDKTFYIKRGIEVEEKKVKLVKGLNTIKFKTCDCNNRIYFNSLGIKIGSKSVNNCACPSTCDLSCTICSNIVFEESDDGCNWRGCPVFGVNLCVQKKCDFKRIMCDHVEDMDKAVLYQAGILWAHEAFSTDRVNAYTLSSKESLTDCLLRWEGGESKATANRFKGKYPKEIENLAHSLKDKLPKECVDCEITEIIGGLK